MVIFFKFRFITLFVFILLIVFIFILFRSSVPASVPRFINYLIYFIMPFKKKIYRDSGIGGVPFLQMDCQETESLVKGQHVVSNIVSVVDVADPVNHPSYPDRECFNDLETQLKAGVPLSRVNTQVLHGDDDEINRELEVSIENDPLKVVENEN